jgi:hypothetical protein
MDVVLPSTTRSGEVDCTSHVQPDSELLFLPGTHENLLNVGGSSNAGGR